MANDANAYQFGLKPIRHSHGAPYNGAANLYYIPSSYGTALFIGDPVVKTGTSNTSVVDCSAGVFQAGMLPEINKATAGDGNATTGVIVGFHALRDNLNQSYNPASTERVAIVADDPGLIFQLKDDGASALAATSVGLNAVYDFGTAGDTRSGLSGVELDTNGDAPAADASNQLTILRLADLPDNEVAADAVWEVRINNHTEAHAAIGI